MACLFFAETYWPFDYRHGTYALESAFRINAAAAERLLPGALPLDFHDALYLDIETTGLTGPAGRLAFLVGVGTFEAFNFRLRQYFLTDLVHEASMLTSLGELIERKKMTVTFNGKRFDVPRMTERLAFNGLPSFLSALPHVDLLVGLRHLYGRRLQSCRLAALETQLLGLDRDGAGGAPSPVLFADHAFVAGTRPFDPLFRHNALDVLALVALVAHLGEVAGNRDSDDAHHLLGLGRWDEANGCLSSAEELFTKAWRLDAGGDEGGEAVARLGELRRRRGDTRAVESIWLEESQASTSDRRRVIASIELARIAERRRDFDAAVALVRQAYSLLESLPRFRRPLHPTLVEVERRFLRLTGRNRPALTDKIGP